MSEAKDLLLSQQLGGQPVGAEGLNVVKFPSAAERPPPLTDEEIVALREMIRGFRAIAVTCPIARKAIGDQP